MSQPTAPVPWGPPSPRDPAHFNIVFDAWLIVCGESERTVKAWRSLLEAAFCVWRDKHGTKPAPTGGLLGLGGPYIDKSLQDCPPYVCAGPQVRNYVDLLMHIVQTSPKDLKWLARYVPWNKMLATMVLAEASDFNSGGIIQAHLALVDLKRQEQEWLLRIQLKVSERLLPLAEHGQKMKRGNPSRKGRTYNIRAAIELVCERAGSTDYQTVLNYFSEYRNTEPLFDAGLTRYKFQGVVDGCVEYTVPDGSEAYEADPEFRRIPVTTLRSYLSRIRKSRTI
jgi:hypothetical protein